MADPKSPGDSTRSVHGGEREHHDDATLTTPIHQTSTFWFKDSEEVRAYAEGRLVRDEYGRYGNPTWRAAERKLCGARGRRGDGALRVGHGRRHHHLPGAAAGRGDHVVVTNDCYRRTRQFIQQLLSKLEVEATVIEPADPIALEGGAPRQHAAVLHRVADEPVPARDRRARGRARGARARREGGHRLHLRLAREPPRARRRRRPRDPQRHQVPRRPQRPDRRHRLRLARGGEAGARSRRRARRRSSTRTPRGCCCAA